MAQTKILLVEDEIAAVKAFGEKLTSHGFLVVKSYNGLDGLNKALEEKPDLILLDILMPGMDGLEMLKKLREDEWGKTVEVILLTNLSDSGRLAESVNLGVHDFLIKTDWKIEDIVSKIKERLHL